MLRIEVREGLEFIHQSTLVVQHWFEGIATPEDFLRDMDSQKTLDAIAMRLQAIGEKVKRIELHDPEFFACRGIDPVPIIRFRDFISHHYEEIDHQIIFTICNTHLPLLKANLTQILSE